MITVLLTRKLYWIQWMPPACVLYKHAKLTECDFLCSAAAAFKQSGQACSPTDHVFPCSFCLHTQAPSFCCTPSPLTNSRFFPPHNVSRGEIRLEIPWGWRPLSCIWGSGIANKGCPAFQISSQQLIWKKRDSALSTDFITEASIL